MGLAEYRRKRDFKATPEPASGGKRGQRIFVVQLHHASHRHFDFRLELDGTLKSWAIPKGPSFDPAIKRLAVEVEDHPLSYADFEGDIPKGHYGGGHVDVFDRGTWEPQGDARDGLRDGELKFTLHGDVLRGSWVLVRTRKQGTKQQWLLIKHRDAYAGPRDADAFVDPHTDRPLPLVQRRKIWPTERRAKLQQSAPTKTTLSHRARRDVTGSVAERLRDAAFTPQLCRSMVAPPAGADWLHEVKWDGYRIVATVVAGKVRLWSRNGIEWTAKAPEITNALKALKVKSAQFDGEMIVLRKGVADFNSLQARLSGENKQPLVYMLFDLPHLNGRSLRRVPLIERKAMLAELLKTRPQSVLRYSEHQLGHGAAVFAQAIAGGIEGIVCKRIDSEYHGSRSGDWVKVKARPSDEFIVVGFTEPRGSRAGIGALLLAKPVEGALRYVGRVGTGLAGEQLRVLRKQLAGSVVAEPSADMSLMERKDRPLAIWVEPKLVIEVFYQGIGGKGLLRQVAFKAIRKDKRPADLKETELSSNTHKAMATKKASAITRKAASVARHASARDAPIAMTPADVVLTHPDRVVFPGTAITKGDVGNYYRAVAEWLLPEIVGRPLSVLRCPDGIGKACFFQKHLTRGIGEHVYGIDIREKSGTNKYLCIHDATGLLELVQMNVLEFHPWGAQVEDIEHADRIVFDLDPHASVAWAQVIAAAREVRKQLASIGLASFARTSGGKGLHIVVPLDPPARWDAAKAFAQAVAEAMAALHPADYVSVAGDKNRRGKIFIDWLRNGRGATSVASYSLRARAGTGVAMPLAWTGLGRVKSGDAFTIANAIAHLRRRAGDPWKNLATTRQSLPDLQAQRPRGRNGKSQSRS